MQIELGLGLLEPRLGFMYGRKKEDKKKAASIKTGNWL